MKLTNKQYDFLKYFALTALPALQIFWNTIAETWELPYRAPISVTIGALGLFLAALIKKSSDNYKAEQQAEICTDDEEEGEADVID